jgi:translation initiation factor IF-2
MEFGIKRISTFVLHLQLSTHKFSHFFVFAFQVDKEGADVSRVSGDLAGFGLLVESLGGEILSAEVSAKQKLGLDELLEKILLQSEVLDLKVFANMCPWLFMAL